jgi:phosphoglycerate dehydrogenase-like enzyme
MGAMRLAQLPSHAVLINAARGSIVDEVAVLDALRQGRLGAAALDVLPVEPPIDNPLYSAYLNAELPNLLLTPHVAWYSQQSVIDLRRKAAEDAFRILRGKRPFGLVTAD